MALVSDHRLRLGQGFPVGAVSSVLRRTKISTSLYYSLTLLLSYSIN